jgi:hypothetical protein
LVERGVDGPGLVRERVADRVHSSVRRQGQRSAQVPHMQER